MTNSRKMSMVQWSDLPPELASDIADRLGLVELLRFRSVCKAWYSTASTALVKIESTPDYEPWFLLYGDHENSDQCQLVTESGDKYTMRLPELDATTCLASNEGWLLVFKEGEGGCKGSIFFFHPFSRAKIDLPNFPVSQVSDHVAAFSSPPTSHDCRVCVISRSHDDELETNMLHCGDNTWLQRKIHSPRNLIDTIKCGAYHNKIFKFYDCRDQVLSLSPNKAAIRPRFSKSVPVHATDKSEGVYYPILDYFKETEMKKKLGLADDDEDVSFSTCGTTKKSHDGLDMFVFNESINSHLVEESKTKSRQFKGVWISPRFYQVSPKHQTW